MKKTRIMFVWREKGKQKCRQLRRRPLYDVFNGLVKGFDGDNEISKKLVELIPEADSIIINKDINATQDVPFITVVTEEKTEMVKIRRYHKIVWSILDKYCTEEEKKE